MKSSIGEQLRSARQAKQLTLEDAARGTKIKIDILERLEAEDFQQLAAPMYVKGFIKNYANYLGLNGAAVGEQFIRSQGGLRRQGLQLETEATLRARQGRDLRLPVGAVVMVVGVVSLLLLIGLGVRHLWKARNKQSVQPVATLPSANVDPYYHPPTPFPAERFESPAP